MGRDSQGEGSHHQAVGTDLRLSTEAPLFFIVDRRLAALSATEDVKRILKETEYNPLQL